MNKSNSKKGYIEKEFVEMFPMSRKTRGDILEERKINEENEITEKILDYKDYEVYFTYGDEDIMDCINRIVKTKSAQ